MCFSDDNYCFVFCNLTYLIALIMFTSICDNYFLLLVILSEFPRAEFNQSYLGEPRVFALALQRSRTGSRLVRVEVSGRKSQQAKGRHDREESAPTKPLLDRLKMSNQVDHILMKVSRLTLLMRAVMRLLMMSPLKRKA